MLRNVAEYGRASFATLSDGEGARAWAVRHSCPVWLVKLLRRELGDESAQAFLVAADAAPERCLRVNTLKAAVPEARTALAAAGLATTGVAGLPAALIYDGPALERSAPFREGSRDAAVTRFPGRRRGGRRRLRAGRHSPRSLRGAGNQDGAACRGGARGRASPPSTTMSSVWA